MCVFFFFDTIFCMLFPVKKWFICFSLAISTTAFPAHLELDVYGLAYHLVGEGYSDAPRRLDEKAAWVFNPGLGITCDFRKNSDDSGLSPLLISGYFQDCDDRPFYFLGSGGRYRYKISKMMRVDLNFGWVYSIAQDWYEETYYGVFMPIGNLGLSTPLFGRWWTCRLTFAPENTGITATSGGDLLFMNVSIEL